MKKLLVLPMIILSLAGCSTSTGTPSGTTYATPVINSSTYVEPGITKTTVIKR